MTTESQSKEQDTTKLTAMPKEPVIAKNRTLRERLSAAPAAISAGLIGLVREMVPVVLFFFVAFFLIFFIFKLLSPKYSIDFSAFTKAAVAALILGKVSLLLNLAQGSRVGTHRRAVVVACRTFLYALVVFALIAAERIFHGVRETGSLQGGISWAIASANLDHFLGLVLLIGLIVGVYLTVQEIDRAMGERALFRLFFEPPVDAGRKLTSEHPDPSPTGTSQNGPPKP
jgi:hypothetical protein